MESSPSKDSSLELTCPLNCPCRIPDTTVRKNPLSLAVTRKLQQLPDANLWKIYKSELIQSHPDHKAQVKDLLFRRFIHDTLKQVEARWKRVPDHSLLEKADMRQEVLKEMYEYLDKFDPHVGTNFMQFFNSGRLHGAMEDCLRDLQNFGRDVPPKLRTFRELFDKLQQDLGRLPTLEDFRQRFGSNYDYILQDELVFTAVYNQPATRSANTNYDSDDEMGRDLAEEQHIAGIQARKGYRSSMEWLEFEQLILNAIPDEQQRLAVWYYRFLGKNSIWIAKRLECSVSSAISKLRRGEAEVKKKYQLQDLKDLLRR